MNRISLYIVIAIVVGVLLVATYAFKQIKSNNPSQSSSTIISVTIPSTNRSQNNSETIILTPDYEIGNTSNVDPNVNFSTFHCNTASDCTIVYTQSCFNNLPSQQACINGNYSASYQSYYENYTGNGTVCPQFFLAGQASCGCISNGCSLEYTKNT